MKKSCRHHHATGSTSLSCRGFTLLETLFVLAILGLCILAGSLSLCSGIGKVGARGAAQIWQAAGTCAQLEALWSGEAVTVKAAPRSLSLSGPDGSGRHLQDVLPAASVSTNLARWRSPDGIAVRFVGLSAAPDGGGSLYFANLRAKYRVTVRPESGLTTCTWSGATP